MSAPTPLVEEIAPSPVANAADTIAVPVQDAYEVVEIAPSPVAESSAVDTSAPPLRDAGEVVELVPSVVAESSAADASAPPLQDPGEVVEMVLSAVAESSAADASAPPLQDPGEVVEMVLSAVAESGAADTSAPLLQDAGEVVELVPSAVVESGAADTSAPPRQDTYEVVESAPSVVTECSPVDPSVPPVQESAENEVSQSLLAAPASEGPPALSVEAFYGLREQPFDVTPDPGYLYLSQVHREALTSLSQGIQNLRGFMALVAEPGMGKTTLLYKLMEELRDSARTVFLFQTQCNSRELLRYLLSELGVEHARMDIVAMHKALNEVLFQEMLQGKRFVLIIDEAQNLRDSVLETIRLLSDFETTHTKLLQIVLAGQPQLVDTLMRPGLSQLRQRIAILTNLKPLNATETAHYIEHRLRAAGSSGEPIFTPDALALIAEGSQGIPRSINNICFNALLLGYSEGLKTIESGIVQRVLAKLDLASLVQSHMADTDDAQTTPLAAPHISSQLRRFLMAALAGEGQSHLASVIGAQAKASITLTGKLTEKLISRSWGKESEFRIEVSLERESSSEIPVADRYYCCSFYVGEEQAKVLRAGQTIRIKIEQD